MPKFTVLLLYPDYSTDNYGGDTWCDGVQAENILEAVTIAQRTSAEDSRLERPEDLVPISIFAGAQPDLINQWIEAARLANATPATT